MKNDEYKIHVALVEYVTRRYPGVLIRSDLAGLKLPIGLAVKAKRLNGGRRAWPDFFMAKSTDQYSGLFIEIKKDADEIYTKTGRLRETKHIQEQKSVLDALMDNGYYAVFGDGLDECMDIVDDYLN